MGFAVREIPSSDPCQNYTTPPTHYIFWCQPFAGYVIETIVHGNVNKKQSLSMSAWIANFINRQNNQENIRLYPLGQKKFSF